MTSQQPSAWAEVEPEMEPEMEPEVEPAREPEPEIGLKPDLPFVPMAEGLPMGDGRPWYLQPEPNWARLSKDLGIAWPLHMYCIGCAFVLLAIVSLYHLICIGRSKRAIAKLYYMTLHALLMLCGITRSIHYLCDPYHSTGNLPLVLVFISHHTYDPSMLSAFILVFVAIIKVTRIRLVSKRLFHPVFLVTVIAVNFLVTWTADIVVAHVMGAMVYMFVCEQYFIIVGILASGSYIYLFCRIYNRVYMTRVKINRMSRKRYEPRKVYQVSKCNSPEKEIHSICDTTLCEETGSNQAEEFDVGSGIRNDKDPNDEFREVDGSKKTCNQQKNTTCKSFSENGSKIPTEALDVQANIPIGDKSQDMECTEQNMREIPQICSNVEMEHCKPQQPKQSVVHLNAQYDNDLSMDSPICNSPEPQKPEKPQRKNTHTGQFSAPKTNAQHEYSQPKDLVEARIPLAATLALLASCVFFLTASCNIVSIIMAACHMCEMPDGTPESWYWWSYQTTMRLLELAMASIIVVIGAMPIYRKDNA